MAFYDHHFQRRGGGFLGRWKDLREDRKLLEFVLCLNPNPKILEIGPGLGHFATHCKSRGIKYEAIEPNLSQAKFIEKLGFKVHAAMVPPVPLPKDYCDVFFASQVIEHMSDHLKAVQLVEEAIRVVRPGGWVVLTAPDISSWREFFWEDYTHNYPTSPRRILTMFQDLELTENRVQQYCSSFFGPMRYLVLLVGLLLPYRLFNWLTGTSLTQGVIFNLKAATLARFIIAGHVPTTKRDKTRSVVNVKHTANQPKDAL